jgi:hypothetical protein
MARQEFMSNTPFQLGLENSPSFRSEYKKRNLWMMDQKTLEQKGIRNLDDRRMFFTPTK